MIQKSLTSTIIALSLILIFPISAFAHVLVTPKEVKIADFQTFTVSVPNEKDIAVTSVRLLLPVGLAELLVTSKPGWIIATKQTGEKTTEINWTGGTIVANQRDDFTFSAQAPGKETTLVWKVYQTYSDGTVVAWDQRPTATENESETFGPYSETKVVNDLAQNQTETRADPTTNYVAYLALLLSTLGLGLSVKKHFTK